MRRGEASFNGAGLEKARKCVCCTQTKRTKSCFNGAGLEMPGEVVDDIVSFLTTFSFKKQ